MSLDSDVELQRQGRGKTIRWLERLGDRAEVTARDGARLARDCTAVTASIGRAQVEQAQSFVAYHARRRPLLVTSFAIGAGVLLGVALGLSTTRGRT